MNKEAELMMSNYIKKVKKSWDYLPKDELKKRIEMVETHILDAIKDQKGELTEVEIIKKSMEELGIPIRTTDIKEIVKGYLSIIIIGIVFIIGDLLYFYPTYKYSISIPYFLIIFTGDVGHEAWKKYIAVHVHDKRINLLYAWIFFPILSLELWLVNTWNLLPSVGIISIFLLGTMIYGIVLIVFTIIAFVSPGEVFEKRCPNCNELLPLNAKYCLKCGESLE